MAYNSVGRYLATLPPKNWPTAVVHGAAIEQYLQRGIKSEHDAIAGSLAMHPRKLYRLISQFKAAQHNNALKFKHGQHSPINRRTLELLDETISQLSENSREPEILKAVQIRCQEENIPSPSLTAVRTRMSRAPERPDLNRRFDLDGDLVLDSCQLDMSGLGPDNQRLPIYIIGLIEMKSGKVLTHNVETARPTPTMALDFLASSKGAIESDDRPKVLLSAIDLPAEGGSTTASVLEGLPLAYDRKKSGAIWAGRAWAASFGRRLGRIQICHHKQSTAKEATPLPFVKEAVKILIERGNARQQGA